MPLPHIPIHFRPGSTVTPHILNSTAMVDFYEKPTTFWTVQ